MKKGGTALIVRFDSAHKVAALLRVYHRDPKRTDAVINNQAMSGLLCFVSALVGLCAPKGRLKVMYRHENGKQLLGARVLVKLENSHDTENQYKPTNSERNNRNLCVGFFFWLSDALSTAGALLPESLENVQFVGAHEKDKNRLHAAIMLSFVSKRSPRYTNFRRTLPDEFVSSMCEIKTTEGMHSSFA